MQAITNYQKYNSFHDLHVSAGRTSPEEQSERAQNLLSKYTSSNDQEREVIFLVKEDLRLKKSEKNTFKITPFVADEMGLIDDKDIPRYLFHRYRYEIFPQIRKLDDYPPYLQIEPASVCNYRCVFCYQTDEVFSNKKSEHMGTMDFALYKQIVDETVGNIEFLSLASRGEPLICKDFEKMMIYSVGKFLNLKVNTNASLLSEKLCHALLCGGAKTVVFSADAAEEPLYSKLRVRGRLDKVLKNIERFQKIRQEQYNKLPVITRVSGVLVDELQNMEAMKKLWGDLVDQISFVKYNPWENVYTSPLSEISEPCSDLWRRMFIWFDGKINPCDTDYKTDLMIGKIKNKSLSDLWKSNSYRKLRDNHENEKRVTVTPCNRCVVV